MKIKIIFVLVCLSAATAVLAHPGSGIVIDKYGQVYFTDTGKGVWKIDKEGKLSFMPASRFHWMAIDPVGYFSKSPKSFAGFFERVTEQSATPALIISSDFPIVINADGNMYYALTRPGASKIVRRTPSGKEMVIVSDKIIEFVSGIASGKDESLYITESSDSNTNTIRKIMLASGSMTEIAKYSAKKSKGTPYGTTPSYCRGLAVDAEGVVYVAATGSRSVLKITPDGTVTTLMQASSPWTPTGVEVHEGEVYVLEWHDVSPAQQEDREAWIPRVRKIGKNGKVTTLATVSRK